MDHGHLHHHMHISSTVGVDPSTGCGGGGTDRLPQWSVQETRDLLIIRADLDPTFMETKRNKLLWEVISTKMKEMGYSRTAEQCKAKWKNLVTRYKGCETMENDGMRQQFPFYNDIQAIFSARIQRMLWMEAEGVPSGSKKRVMQLSSDDDDEKEESDQEKTASGSKHKKKKVVKSSTIIKSPSGTISNNIKEMLEEFMNQQMQMELQWMKAFEAKEEERRLKEMEWRQTMEALENERMMLDQRWREREEQRIMRDEVRSEKRDALITALLNKLKRQDM